MTSARELVIHALTAMSDHGNAIASKAVHYFGLASVGGGVVMGAASDTVSRITNPEIWQLSDWAAIVSIVGGITFIIKNVVDTYFNVKNSKERKDADTRD